MLNVTVDEIQRDPLKYLRQVEAGETLVIVRSDKPIVPSAAPLVQLAHARALREDWTSPERLEPLYLRKPDAEINWVTRDGRHRG